MLDSKRVSDLNNRSVQLTDAELSLVDRFSVSLPMNELPEIVVVGSGGKSKPEAGEDDGPATIPFPQDSAATQTVAKAATSADPAVASTESSRDPLATSTDLPIGTDVVMPKDELDLSPAAKPPQEPSADLSANSQGSSEQESLSNENHEAAIFNIEDYATFHDRFESIAHSLERSLNNQFPASVAITSPAENGSQNKVVSSLISNLAQSHPSLKMIAIQGYEYEDETEQFSIGLGQVLAEENELEEAVIPTTIESLDYLAYSQFESLLSTTFKSRFEKVLTELKKHYDLVIVNSKCATEPETKAIAEIADATYLIVSLADVDQDLAINASEELRQGGAHLAGCILTESV